MEILITSAWLLFSVHIFRFTPLDECKNEEEAGEAVAAGEVGEKDEQHQQGEEEEKAAADEAEKEIAADEEEEGGQLFCHKTCHLSLDAYVK